jgi:hypothetical protein
MADFKRAFSEGLKASTDAERAKSEVLEVLGSFATAVGEASGGVIEVGMGKNLKQRFNEVATWFDPRPKNKSRDALFAFRADAKDTGTVDLCEYELAAFGYPVTLTYGENDVVCDDRVSLEAELEKLLADPTTGTKLRRLMKGDKAKSLPAATPRPKRAASPAKTAGTHRRG